MSKKILIVEDDPQLQSALKDSFELEHIEVLTASNGLEGLQKMEENPDLVLIDILLPKMDGITMAKEIRKSHTSLPLMFLTNFDDNEHIAAASEAALSDYFIKSDTDIQTIVSEAKKRLKLS